MSKKENIQIKNFIIVLVLAVLLVSISFNILYLNSIYFLTHEVNQLKNTMTPVSAQEFDIMKKEINRLSNQKYDK
jgi:cell division protein FtsB